MTQTETRPEADDLGPWPTLERVIRMLHAPVEDSAELINRITAEAVRLVPVARDAGVILLDPDRHLRTVFATGAVPMKLDELQMSMGTGPCLTAARKQIVVRMHDIAADTRWGEFCAAALENEVSSMLCIPLHVEDQLLGTLSLYGAGPSVFRDGVEPVARVLAALSAIALAEAQQQERMERALHNRDLIGQAKGILMHRHGVDADTAFGLLRAHSQRTNNKLLAVAERVVETGALE